METLDMVWMLIALTLGTQIPRFLPLVLPKHWLANPVLQKLNKMLPLVIMLLLVFTSLSLPQSRDGLPLFTAQLLALISVILSYKWLGNIFLSVSLGILNLNLLLWVMG